MPNSITISRGSTSVELWGELELDRETGRPASQIRGRPGPLPDYIDKDRAASDVFKLSGTFTTSASTNAKTLVEDIIRPPLGRGSITLDFNGVFGLGSYSVFPDGSRAARTSIAGGEKGVVHLDTLKLRTVNNS